MLCFQIIGFDAANSLAVAGGQLDLNVMMPLLALQPDPRARSCC